MDIVDLIKECKTEQDLKELAKDVIESFSNLSEQENEDENYIGTKLDVNPTNFHIDDPNFLIDKYYKCVNFWYGYIPLGTKIVYGREFIPKYRTSSHKGYYYYLDDDSYIFEFFKYIKENDVESEFDLIYLAFIFSTKWLNKKRKEFNSKDRNQMHTLINKTSDLYYRPIKEHSIKDFYGNGSAMCSELAVFAENLLSAFGLEVMYFMDKEHAYNLFVEHVDEKNIELYIVDFSDWVDCYDENMNIIYTLPFVGRIENGTEELLDQMVNYGKRIKVNDYLIYRINGNAYKIELNLERNYGTDFALENEKTLIFKRKKDV